MRSITIDQKSITAAAAGQLDLEPLCNSLALPLSDGQTRCVLVGEHGYVLSRSFQPSDALLTISLDADGPLAGLGTEVREEALARLLRCTMMLVTGRTRSFPVAWRAYHSRNRVTFQADRYLRSTDGGKTDAGRVAVEFSHEVAGYRAFAFLLDKSGVKDLASLSVPANLHRDALLGVPQALVAKEVAVAKGGLGNEVNLGGPLPLKQHGHVSSDEWYKSRLTTEQRRFVDHPHTGSVRLVGPAGTGKTIALVVKCLRDINAVNSDGSQKRFLFLTHAESTANAIENLVLGMEPQLGLQLLASEKPRLVISTLYALANRQMRYDLADLTPVSLDGHEGRAFQADVLNEVIEQLRNGDWVTYKSKCSGPFVRYMEAEPSSSERRFFLWELLNEFACVLDAEGVRSGTARREQYLSEKRKNWMMMLSSKEEREVVLDLYDRFRSSLREMKAIGGDQMVTDFLNDLDSFRWEATRNAEGFDAVFVDELHLFNRQERMVFRHLFRFPDETPTVFMAYDAKQSPRDTFLALPSLDTNQLDFWRDTKLGKVEKIELIDVFRYTPQITKALSCIDESFPGQDLDDDWPDYSGVSKIDDGPTPTLCETKSTIATYTVVFRRARALQRELGRTGRVAVLCASNELFKRYLDFTDLRESFIAITSRDEASAIQHSARKFIYSMPEYVAGLQFDTVLLIDVNQGEVPDGPYSAAALRKFVSQVYLGASRAERRLEFYASKEHGGASRLLTRAVLSKVVDRVDEHLISVD